MFMLLAICVLCAIFGASLFAVSLKVAGEILKIIGAIFITPITIMILIATGIMYIVLPIFVLIGIVWFVRVLKD